MPTNDSESVTLEFEIDIVTNIDYELPLSTETEIVFNF